MTDSQTIRAQPAGLALAQWLGLAILPAVLAPFLAIPIIAAVSWWRVEPSDDLRTWMILSQLFAVFSLVPLFCLNGALYGVFSRLRIARGRVGPLAALVMDAIAHAAGLIALLQQNEGILP